MLVYVTVCGTSWARVTFSLGVVFDSESTPRRSGSTGMGVLKICAEPRTRLSANVQCLRQPVPAVRARTAGGGANSESCTSQCCAVAAIASSTPAGHEWTTNAAVDASDAGGMICDGPAM